MIVCHYVQLRFKLGKQFLPSFAISGDGCTSGSFEFYGFNKSLFFLIGIGIFKFNHSQSGNGFLIKPICIVKVGFFSQIPSLIKRFFQFFSISRFDVCQAKNLIIRYNLLIKRIFGHCCQIIKREFAFALKLDSGKIFFIAQILKHFHGTVINIGNIGFIHHNVF